ncbi:MAG: WxL domain-containing protein [Vagococcus sp.]|uniref:lectin-like domain-containing protein n=1 Tax=Vagococcus sp. TaxID=1933889 RepID=UPI002FCA3BD1
MKRPIIINKLAIYLMFIFLIGCVSLPRIVEAANDTFTEPIDSVDVFKDMEVSLSVLDNDEHVLIVNYPTNFKVNEQQIKQKNASILEKFVIKSNEQQLVLTIKENMMSQSVIIVGQFLAIGEYSFSAENEKNESSEITVQVVENEDETFATRSSFQNVVSHNTSSLTRMMSLPDDPDILLINKIFQAPIGTSTSILENGKLLQLNPAKKTQRGAIWSKEQISLLSDFTFKSYLYLGDQYANAADGMTFTLTNDPRMTVYPTNVIGSTGVGIGAYSSGYNQPYIRNALSIEFDTYKNQGTSDRMDREITTDNKGYGHVAFVTPKINNQSYTGEHSGVTVAPTYLSNNSWRTLIVKWNAKEQKLTYDLEGIGSKSYVVSNLLSQFGSTSVYWGFTSSTGAFFEENSLAITEIPSNVTSKAEIRRTDGEYMTEVEAGKGDKLFIKNKLNVENDFIDDKNSQVTLEIPQELTYIDNSLTIDGKLLDSNEFSLIDNLLTVNIKKYLASKQELVIELETNVEDASVEREVSTSFGYLEDSVMFLRSNKVSVNITKPKVQTLNVFYKELETDIDVAPTKKITGELGVPYQEDALKINGYVLDHDSGNTSGIYSEGSSDIYFYYKKGELVFVSAPEVLNFGDNLTIDTTDKTYPILSQKSQLVVQDFRGDHKKWRMTATLLKELTNQDDYVLKNSLYYKQNNQEDEFSIGNAINIMENETINTQPVDISSFWSGLEKGPILKVKAGKAAAGNYSGTIQWALEDVPLNGG